MAVICTTYHDPDAAREACRSLASSGVSRDHIALLLSAASAGSVSDAGGSEIVICDDAGEHSWPSSDAAARDLLLRAHAPECSVEHMLAELHTGGAVLIAGIDQLDGGITAALNSPWLHALSSTTHV